MAQISTTDRAIVSKTDDARERPDSIGFGLVSPRPPSSTRSPDQPSGRSFGRLRAETRSTTGVEIAVRRDDLASKSLQAILTPDVEGRLLEHVKGIIAE